MPTALDPARPRVEEPVADLVTPPRAPVPDEWPYRIGLYLPFAIGVVLAFAITPDDALITLRYAWNVVHGHGPVFNPGERVEGYSSPLHLLVDIGVVLIPGGLHVLKVKLVSVLFGVLALREAGRLIRELNFPRWATWLACVLCGSSWILACAATNGLETTLSCWLTTMLVVRLVRGPERADWRWTALIGAACVLARPDAAFVVGALVAASALQHDPTPWGRRLRWAIGPAAALAVEEVTRLAYFHAVLPNTYYAKRTALDPGTIRAGLQYVLNGLGPAPLGLAVAALVVGGIVIVVMGSRRRWFVPAAVGAQLAFVLAAGGDWMRGHRFLAPVLPELVVLMVLPLVALAGAGAGAASSPSNRVRTAAIAASSALLLWATVSLVPAQAISISRSGGHFDDSTLVSISAYRPGPGWLLGPRLLACARPGDVVAYSELGYAGMARTDLRFVDTRGLTDGPIAHHSLEPTRSPLGVTDPDWYSTSSPVGREILATNAAFIIEFDGPPRTTALDGRYRQVQSVPYQGLDFTLYRRIDRPCAPVAVTVPR